MRREFFNWKKRRNASEMILLKLKSRLWNWNVSFNW
ncbi:hypothetical protein GCK32_001126 [Trichostrongylus colubriformis]|uniref:Uncharacterized protein n=1 Tax=Trichostrongylus colubriformis TaxID=6319 RepID=A0AAN8FNJ3_TRICO